MIKKIIMFGAISVLAILGVLSLLILLAGVITSALGLEINKFLVGVAALIAVIAFTPWSSLAWPRAYRCRGSAVIQASLDEVWDWVQIRPRDDYYGISISVIRPVPGVPGEYHMMFDQSPLEGMPTHVHVRLDEEIPREYLRMTTLNAAEMPLFAKDHVQTEIFLEEVEGGVQVTHCETLARLTLLSIPAFLFLNPARDTMMSLKAQIEGTEDRSIMRQMQELDQPE